MQKPRFGSALRSYQTQFAWVLFSLTPGIVSHRQGLGYGLWLARDARDIRLMKAARQKHRGADFLQDDFLAVPIELEPSTRICPHGWDGIDRKK
jgi:hypothetical protein